MKKKSTPLSVLLTLSCLAFFFLTSCNLTSTTDADDSESESGSTFTLTSEAISDGQLLSNFKCK